MGGDVAKCFPVIQIFFPYMSDFSESIKMFPDLS